MTTPATRVNGTALTKAFSVAINSNAYANSADALRIQQSALSTPGLPLADFRLTGVAFSAAPTTGSVQLVKVPRNASGGIGPTPVSTLTGFPTWTFSPAPNTGNTSTGWDMSIDSVPLDADADYWLFNNGTGVSMAYSGMVLTATPWSLGT